MKRVPAIPLVTVDPHLSIWMCADRLTDDFTRHWTGSRCALTGLLRVDGRWLRFLGKEEPFAPAMEQEGLEIRATATVGRFICPEVTLTVTFRTPLLLDDLTLMSRPVSYVSYEIVSRDGREHETELYFDASAEAAVNEPTQPVVFGRSGFSVFCGRGREGMLAKSGDDMRIDWGWFHLFGEGFRERLFDWAARRKYLIGEEPEEIEEGVPVTITDRFPCLCLTKEEPVPADGGARGFFCIGYDDVCSIEYFGRRLTGYWKKDGASFEDAARDALAQEAGITARADRFDAELAERAGKISPAYAEIVSLAYRQAVAAHKLVWDGEKPLFFSKECYSNGCIGTVDLTYPSMPLFLLYNPDLVCALLDPVFEYAASGRWEYPFAPHDLGQYPLANGQVYGYDARTRELRYEEQMPVEECGNMLLCTAAVCWQRKNADYAKKNEALLSQWANYLSEKGFDPENQLCTDDFGGHFAHNCNLSIKAVMGIAAWGMLLSMMGRGAEGEAFTCKARELAGQWKAAAFDGDHYRLAFDQPGSWSIKYNLVWDKLFGLHIFDEDIFETEASFYRTKLNRYGMPLDSRKGYTKSDWQGWATVLSGGELSGPIYDAMREFLRDTPDRVPFTDYYETVVPEQCGFQNRSVQGGLFINLL